MARNQPLRNAQRQGNRPSSDVVKPSTNTARTTTPASNTSNTPDGTEVERYVVIYNKSNTRIINPYVDLMDQTFVKIPQHAKDLMFENCDVTDLEDVTDTLSPAVLERMEPKLPVSNVVVEEWLSEQE